MIGHNLKHGLVSADDLLNLFLHLKLNFHLFVVFMQLDSSSAVLVTGGTGSFGKLCCLNSRTCPDIQRLVIYSRDELKQWELQQIYPENEYPQLRFFLGDIRDSERLSCAGKELILLSRCCSKASASC